MARDFSSTSGEADAAAEALRELAGLYAAAGDYRSAYDAQVEFQEQWEELRSQQSDIAAATLQAIFETQLAQRRSRLFEELAEHDQLTGLGNRRYLYQRLPGLLQTAQRQDSPLSLAMIDLDHFKAINDSHSHDVGDAVLESVGCLLRDAVAGSGFAVRLGGEEFVLAMPDCALEKAHGISITMCNSLATHDWAAISRGLAVTASVGLVVNTCDDTASSLLHRADEHLYRAKREGRDRVVSQNDPTANPVPTVEMTALRR